VDAIKLTIEEEQSRSALAHKHTQDTLSLTEAQELKTLRKRKTYANSTRKLFGILCSKISNRLRR
jgi:hypothetical protein